MTWPGAVTPAMGSVRRRAFLYAASEVRRTARDVISLRDAGEPKGVMLSHRHLVRPIAGPQSWVTTLIRLFLPSLSHSFGGAVSVRHLANGVTIVFAESMETVGKDMVACVRP